jgi:polysaccharide biosynthesis protein PslF
VKIAVLAARLPPATDGVGDHAAKLAGALAAADHDVVVISAGEAEPRAGYRLELAGGSWGSADTLRAVALFVQERADALVVEYTPFLYGARSLAPLALLLAARARNVPSAIVAHEAFYARSHDGVGGSALKAAFLTARDRIVLSAANEVIVPSGERASRIAGIIPALCGRTNVVRIGANVEPPPAYERVAASPAELVAFGVVSPRRRLDRAIDALALLLAEGRDIVLKIVGRIYDRGYAAEMLLRAQALGISERVEFCGERTPAELSALLAGATAAIHAAREGAIASSGALLALLAHGVPTVAVRTADDDAVFADALQYAGDTPEAVASAVRTLIKRPDDARALSARAVALYQTQFGWDTVAAGVLRTLNKERTDARLVTA